MLCPTNFGSFVPIADITCVERPQRAEVRDAGVAVNGHE
jgi:hypothetical protein